MIHSLWVNEGVGETNHRQITAESTPAAAAAAIQMWRRLLCDSYTFTQFTFNYLQSLLPWQLQTNKPRYSFLLEGWFSFCRISPFLLLQKVPTSFTNEVMLDAISFPAEEEDHTLSLRASFFLQKTIVTFFIWSINPTCPVYNLSAWRVTQNLTCPDENPLTKLFCPIANIQNHW